MIKYMSCILKWFRTIFQLTYDVTFALILQLNVADYYLLFYMYQLNYYSSSSIYVTVHSYFKNVSQPTGSYK